MRSSLPTLFSVFRRSGITILPLLLMAIAPTSLLSQNLIVHSAFSFDDGTEGQDADGVKNGVVVWSAGKVHVVDGEYHLYKGEELVIQPGAIVKFADDFVYQDGEVKSFRAPTSSALVSVYYYPDIGGIIKIDGATLTDIRDDEVGGDSNGDGAATKPQDLLPSLSIRFSGSNEDYLKNSTLKYFAKIGHLGSMKITGNNFIEFVWIATGGGYPLGMGPIPINSSPELSGNTFNFRSFGGFVDLRGMTPIVQGNRFTGGGDATSQLQIGLSQASVGNFDEGEILPRSGTAYVTDNIFESKGGIIADAANDGDSLFTRSSFSAVIRNNLFRCRQGSGNQAISVCVDADIEVTANIVENFNTPLSINFDRGSSNSQRSGLRINYNRFEALPGATGPGNTSLFMNKGIMINAENNYWGDASGPLDNLNTDGLFNPRGKGIRIGEGIDYVPFIGGTTTRQRDYIAISATTSPSPLAPATAATINVVVQRYDLVSAPTGKIVVIVRDANGYTINPPGTSVDVTSGSQSASIPPIQITVPELATAVTVEAYIVPDGEFEALGSNPIRFDVPQPKSSFKLIGIYDPATGFPLLPILTRGSSLSAEVQFQYTHTTSSVHFEIELREVDGTTGATIEVLRQEAFTVPPGIDRKESRTFSITIPMRDILLVPKSDLYGRFVAKDDNGTVLGKVDGKLPILASANFLNVKLGVPYGTQNGQLVDLGRRFFIEGDAAIVGVRIDYTVATRNVADWQIWPGPVEIMDASGTVIHTYASTAPMISNVTTGKVTGRDLVVRPADGAPTIPAGARKARVHVRLVRPQGNLTVATSFVDIEIRPRPVNTVQLNVAPGAQTLSFAPIPVSLDFASNQEPGIATAMEFNGQFFATRTSKESASIQRSDYWKMIPLNRYWSVFDTLDDGSFAATLAITYDPATDFPATPGFNEDSLVVCGFNRYSMELEELPTSLDRNTRTLTTPYSKFFDTYVAASRSTLSAEVDDRQAPVAGSFASYTIYPNPAGERTTFRFDLRRGGDVLLEIVNMRGERVALLQNGYLEAGVHETQWETHNAPGGMYMARLRTGEEVRQIKVLHRE